MEIDKYKKVNELLERASSEVQRQRDEQRAKGEFTTVLDFETQIIPLLSFEDQEMIQRYFDNELTDEDISLSEFITLVLVSCYL